MSHSLTGHYLDVMFWKKLIENLLLVTLVCIVMLMALLVIKFVTLAARIVVLKTFCFAYRWPMPAIFIIQFVNHSILLAMSE